MNALARERRASQPFARAAMLALLSLLALPAGAFPLSAQAAPPVEAAHLRTPAGGSSASFVVRQPLVEDALRSFGYRAERLTRAEERALEETYSELYPGMDPRRTRLNRSQATALVYMALVHGNRRDDARWDRRGCEPAARRVHQLEDYFRAPGRGQPRYLQRAEQQSLLEEAREIQRQARGCGEYQLADQASELVILLSRQQAERELVARQVDRMKALARYAMGR